MKTRARHSRSFRLLAGFVAFAQGALAIPLGAEPAPMPSMVAPAPQANPTPTPTPPPPPTVVIPSQPTDEELFRLRLFAEPLVPVGGPTTPAHNAALASALNAYKAQGAGEAVAPLRQFLQGAANSPWRASLLVNLSVIMRRTGHYSRALADAQEAWQLAKASTGVRQAAVADRALGEIVELLSRLGRYQDLETLLAEVAARNVLGSATEKVSQAKQALWIMQNQPDVAFRCGPLAVERVFMTLHPGVTPPAAITNAVSTNQGTSLAQMAQVSQQAGMSLRMAFRPVGKAILVPALVHWGAGHFAAIVKEQSGRYLVQDPTFGEETWLSREAIDDEASGYFLVSASGSLPAGWRSVDAAEGGTVWGKGTPAGQNTPNQGCEGGPQDGGDGGSCGCSSPMATYSFHTMLVNLHIVDTPVRYSQAVGPTVAFQVSYNQRDAFQPQNFNYGNMGPKWTHNWLSYVTDDPGVVGGTVTVYLPGGGEETYTSYNAGTQLYGAHYMKRTVLKRVAGSPIEYHRIHSDGSKEIFTQSDGGLSPIRKVFLSQIVDAQGQAVTFQYDASLRLVSVTDATGLATTLSYEAADALRITKVTDPFGRFATFTYSASPGAPLASITDPIGITSQFAYGDNNFIKELTTPYGTTKFAMGDSGKERWLEAVDPLGGRERLVYQNGHSSFVPATDPPATVPPGFSNSGLNSGLSFFWDKRAMALHPGDFSKAEMSLWLWSGANLSTAVLRSSKKPLENRVWYKYPAQSNLQFVGTHSTPTESARVLDDGTTQSDRGEYNAAGKKIKDIDPLGRETVYVYGTGSTPDVNATTGTGIDLLQVKQKNGANYDLTWSATYDANHQVLSSTDAAGQTTTNTYLPDGRLQTTTTPARNGPNGVPLTLAERTTTYSYHPDNDIPSRRKRLQTVTGPSSAQGSPSTTYTYDSVGRLATTTDQEGYTLTYDYDVLDRMTRVTYPDGTYEETDYNRLDANRRRDRLGRTAHTVHDALRRVVSTTDPLGRTVTQQYCTCGSLERLVDANGNATRWEYDFKGRVTKEIRADDATWEYTYETTTDRLKEKKDAKGQITSYQYLNDGKLEEVSYPNAENPTPAVAYTYEPIHGRLETMTDGIGTTTYAYYPDTPVALGAGSLAGVDGPLANDTVSYTYDEMGRIASRGLTGFVTTYTYDGLGRLARQGSPLGDFTYTYDGATGRPLTLNYPNGQSTAYLYFPTAQDHRLQEIKHLSPSASILAKFNYTYDAVSNIKTWRQQYGTDPAQVYELGYDLADQLTAATLKSTDPTPAVMKSYAYAYDRAGNRTVESIDSTVVGVSHNSRNQLVSQQVGGALRFAGTLDEPAAVTVDGQPATVDASNRFEGTAPVTAGTSTVTITAQDYAQPPNVGTQEYEINVTGSTGSASYDLSGNLTSDGTKTYEWDAEHRLTTVKQGSTTLASFTYDGKGRRAAKTAGGITTSYVYDGPQFLEERPGVGTSKRYVYGPGIDRPLAQAVGSTTSYFVADHLGSIAQVTDSLGTPALAREYDPWGNIVQGSSTSGYAFTGREWESETDLYYYRARYYDPQTGRFLSEDPMGLAAGSNLYLYVLNSPTARIDPTGYKASSQVDMHAVNDLAILTMRKMWPDCQRLRFNSKDERLALICECDNGKVFVTPIRPFIAGSETPTCPGGKDKNVGVVHCHPPSSDPVMDEAFSYEDQFNVTFGGTFSACYLLTPTGRMRRYPPESGDGGPDFLGQLQPE